MLRGVEVERMLELCKHSLTITAISSQLCVNDRATHYSLLQEHTEKHNTNTVQLNENSMRANSAHLNRLLK